MEIQLEDFISQSLKQIIDAVIETQKYAKTVNSKVNPQLSIANEKSIKCENYFINLRGDFGQFIEFDLAVSASQGKNEKEKIGVSVLQIGLSKKWFKISSESNISRIKFSIPVILPVQQ